jgi:hypothetical protein
LGDLRLNLWQIARLPISIRGVRFVPVWQQFD